MDIKVIETPVNVEAIKFEAMEMLYYRLIHAWADCAIDDLGIDDYLSNEELRIFDERVTSNLRAIEPSLASTDPDEFATAFTGIFIATKVVDATIKEVVKQIADERERYYRVDMSYSGEFTICVKAHNEDEAREYADSLDHYDLIDEVDLYNANFEVDWFHDDDMGGPGCYEVFDATED